MIQHIVSDEIFQPIRNRFESWKAAKLADCDENLVSSLMAINKIDGLATVFCCEGYRTTKNDVTYVMFAVTKDGLPKLFELYGKIVDAAENKYSIHNLALSAKFKIAPFTDIALVYPCWILAHDYNCDEDRIAFIASLHQAAESMIEG